MTDARVSGVRLEALLSFDAKARVSQIRLEALVSTQQIATAGPTLKWFDGAAEQAATVEGWWDGTAVQTLTVAGWWDGTAVQPLS